MITYGKPQTTRLHTLGCRWLALIAIGLLACQVEAQDSHATLTAEEWASIREAENQRIQVVEKVIGSVVAIYGPSRQGGGSGVIIDPSGIALTNHHVIEGAGMQGLGGLSDGALYEWELIGTDPGGDVAIIQMKGRDSFPWSPLGNSDHVQVGDWALAMGNPFLLADNQVPTVTLGVVSGIERFQEGMGSQLVYGNCIQVDSSINPGNSGGPLFNMQGEVIGINGRGSFRDRGRVNVGLGYAISANQIKNFLPDLLATKIVEHGTLDAAFSNRDGKVVCATIDLDAPVAKAGLELGDELLEFEGRPIAYANQFKNLICTLPEDWPADLLIRKPDGSQKRIRVRLFGLPYNFQADESRSAPEDEKQPRPEEEKRDPADDPTPPPDQPGDPEPPAEDPPPAADNADLKKYLQHEAGVVVDQERNARNAHLLVEKWRASTSPAAVEWKGLKLVDAIFRDEARVGEQTLHVAVDGRFHVQHQMDQDQQSYLFDGQDFWDLNAGDAPRQLDLVEVKTNPLVTQAMALLATLQPTPFPVMGTRILDGSDKCQGVVTSRLMWLDDDDDWFYGWLSTQDEQGHGQVRLRKIASDKDCSGSNAGLLFDDYRDTFGIQLPWQKCQVKGLGEQVQWTAVTQEVTPWQEMDADLFRSHKEGPR